MAITDDYGFYRRGYISPFDARRETADVQPAAFDYQFGALTKSDNEFMQAYFGLMFVETFFCHIKH